MKIKLTREQFQYLNFNLPEQLADLIKNVNDIGSNLVLLEVDENTIDEFRDWAGERLQKVGFDVSYKLTIEGKILEELTDRFYLK